MRARMTRLGTMVEKALTLHTTQIATPQVVGGMRGERLRAAVQFPIWRCTAATFKSTAAISCDLHERCGIELMAPLVVD
jgi:hypothetical protein